jgi:hypothetical protein
MKGILMNVKLTPNNDLKEVLKEYFEGREVLYVIAKANSRDKYAKTKHLQESQKRRIRPVKCLTNSKVYSTIKDAATELALNPGSVSKVCNGKLSSTGGYRFEYQ